MPQLTLALLGPPRIERDGAPLVVDTRKAVALLALLALADTPLTRASLSALLWPEFDRSHARAALRRTLSVLKKGVGEGVLAIDRLTLTIAGDADLHLDVAAFRATWRAADGRAADDPDALAHLERAVTLYRGDLLEGFGLRDSAPFDDWQADEAEALRRELAGALERLVAGRERRGELEAALGHARRWLELDPLHEGVHRTLMRLLARAGRRSEALQQYRSCVRVLEQELGVAPLDETDALYRAIMEGALPPPAGAPTSPSKGPLPTAGADPAQERSGRSAPEPSPVERSLVGRSEAWSTLGAARERSRIRRFLLAIEGEAGIGKSYLADAFLEEVGARGGRALSARCYPDEHHLPYGPILDLLRSALARPDATERLTTVESRWLSEASRLAPDLTHLLPGLAPPPPLDGPVGRNHLFEGVDRVLSALLAGAQPGVLLLDDAHWADPATLELLAYLARPERHPGLLLLLALRPERNEAHARLQRLLVAGEREGRADQLTLERWGRKEVDELLQRRGAELDATGAARLFEESEGLPFFVSEYLAALTRRDGWGELPQGVRDLLHSRLDTADAVERQLLQTAATIGRSFDFDLLRRASGRVDDEVVAGLERLVALDLVREVDGTDGSIRFDFGHEKLRALVYDEASLIRRRLLHGRIADTLLAEGAPPRRSAPAGLVGSHLRLAGREPEAALQFAQAGDQARSLFANPPRGDRRPPHPGRRLRPRYHRLRDRRGDGEHRSSGPAGAQARQRPPAPRRLGDGREPLPGGRSVDRRRRRSCRGAAARRPQPQRPATRPSRRSAGAGRAGALAGRALGRHHHPGAGPQPARHARPPARRPGDLGPRPGAEPGADRRRCRPLGPDRSAQQPGAGAGRSRRPRRGARSAGGGAHPLSTPGGPPPRGGAAHQQRRPAPRGRS
jgi:DNA-binding SARP family transcriptional activator